MRVLVSVAILAFAIPAFADDAVDLKKEGDTALLERRYIEALDAYDRAYALSPNPALDYNRGRALQFLARFPEALDAFERFEKTATPDLLAKVPGLGEVLDDLRSKVATVTITTNASKGRILIGGKDAGVSSRGQPLRVNAGTTTIDVIADGYFPWRREVTLPAKTTTSVDAKLTPRDAFGYLVVTSRVPGTKAVVDGTPIGVVPADTALLPGSHPVRSTHEGYDDATTQIVIRAGEHRTLELDPTQPRSSSIASHWWFWAGVGAAVVTATIVIIAVAANTEQGAPTGDFSPGQVRF